jgi:hypothetical protein
MAKKINKTRVGYNAFKMWGSWIGLIIGIAVAFLSTPLICFDTCPQIFGFVQVYVALAIICFLIGWGIHSLIRKSRSNN